MCVWHRETETETQRQRGVSIWRVLRTGVTGDCELLDLGWKLNTGSLAELQIFWNCWSIFPALLHDLTENMLYEFRREIPFLCPWFKTEIFSWFKITSLSWYYFFKGSLAFTEWSNSSTFSSGSNTPFSTFSIILVRFFHWNFHFQNDFSLVFLQKFSLLSYTFITWINFLISFSSLCSLGEYSCLLWVV